MPDNLGKAKEAAKFLGVQPHFLYAHRDIPRHQIGPRTYRYDLEELLKWSAINQGEGPNRPVTHSSSLYR